MNLKRARELESQGLISVNKHNDYDLWVLKYTNKVTYDDLWTPEIRRCRGLVINRDKIIAKPFDKFFNHNQSEVYKPEPNEEFQVFEKMDGSLGITFYFDNKWIMTTQGSFHSEQADRGNEMLYEQHANELQYLDRSCTYLFEIIYPENRIVVDYTDEEKLVLLGKIKTKRNIDLSLASYEVNGFNVVKQLDYHHWEKLVDLDRENEEGFVIKFISGNRIKIKFSEYLRLHRIVTGCTSYDIWKHLKSGEPLDHLLDRVPDEFREFVTDQISEITAKFETLKKQSIENYLYCRDTNFDTRGNRQTFVNIAKTFNDFGRIMCLLDAKSIDESVWKDCKPDFKKPFQ